MTRKEYKGARRLLRDNGKYSLRWMNTRIAQALRQLIEAPADELAAKARFYSAPTMGNAGAGLPAAWNKHGPCLVLHFQRQAIARAAFAKHVSAEKQL